jgi:hypothetical protein
MKRHPSAKPRARLTSVRRNTECLQRVVGSAAKPRFRQRLEKAPWGLFKLARGNKQNKVTVMSRTSNSTASTGVTTRVVTLMLSSAIWLSAGIANTGANAADTPAPAANSVAKQCKASKDDVRRECEAVAAEMAKPAPPQKVLDDRKMVTHSSAVMDTKDQRAVEAKPAAKPAAPTPATKAAPAEPKEATK